MRDEIEQSLKETWNLEKISVIASFVVWTWCLTNHKTLGNEILIWTPAPVRRSVLSRSLGLLIQMCYIGVYIKRVEKRFSLPDGLGWESSNLNDPIRVVVGIVFWLGLIAMTIIIPFLFHKLP